MQNMFITIDGGDGCGKSTQLKLLEKRLSDCGHNVVTCYDPGCTPLGERVREILLHGHELEIATRTEMFLFMAARSQLVEEIIRPALATGKTVLCDRFLLSTIVYQGIAGGVSVDEITEAGRIAVYGVMPDIGFVLDVPYEVSQQRLKISRDKADRMESKGETYHRKVREGFVSYATIEPNRYVIVDASQPVDVVATAIWTAVCNKTAN
ncbi:MAG: dTMP kinase [Planctomycetaceae bacterium]|jgi:dTMP kinase|nr:dTMP kinase [Planctomycetaceae bacterium]